MLYYRQRPVEYRKSRIQAYPTKRQNIYNNWGTACKLGKISHGLPLSLKNVQTIPCPVFCFLFVLFFKLAKLQTRSKLEILIRIVKKDKWSFSFCSILVSNEYPHLRANNQPFLCYLLNKRSSLVFVKTVISTT